MDQRAPLHPGLHLRVAGASSGTLLVGRLLGLGLIDFEVAVSEHHAGPDWLLVVLAVLANLATLAWALRLQSRRSGQAAALALMAFAGGLLAALQHGDAALVLPAVAVSVAAADGAVLDALGTFTLGFVALEVGVLWADLGSSAALGYPAILVGAGLLGLTRRQYVAQGRAAQALVAQTLRTESESRRAAALDERTRLAREIHDVLAHALGGLTVQLEAAELLLGERGDVDGALERIRVCQGTAREGLEEARRAVAALRSDAPPLPESLAGLLDAHREQGARGELIVEGSGRELPPEAALALMRAVQEGLTNARRHAPGSGVRVRLRFEEHSTSVTVTNGEPRRAQSAAGGRTGGYGLTGMRERLELAGGQLVAGPSGRGWSVRAEVPA
ncbi:MAG: sensor histidine kinase [Solirubrobacteraceae bacterium]